MTTDYDDTDADTDDFDDDPLADEYDDPLVTRPLVADEEEEFLGFVAGDLAGADGELFVDPILGDGFD